MQTVEDLRRTAGDSAARDRQALVAEFGAGLGLEGGSSPSGLGQSHLEGLEITRVVRAAAGIDAACSGGVPPGSGFGEADGGAGGGVGGDDEQGWDDVGGWPSAVGDGELDRQG